MEDESVGILFRVECLAWLGKDEMKESFTTLESNKQSR